jgi:acyl-CoA thioesterase-1
MRFLFLIVTIQSFGQIQVKDTIRYLALGDSYTIGASITYDERWPSQLYDSLGKRGNVQDTLIYIATSGWTTTSLKNAINSNSPDIEFNLVSLLIGVNNQFQGRPFYIYEREFPELVSTALEFAQWDTSQVFVVSIPDYAYTSFGGGSEYISSQLDMYNQFAEEYCDSLGITFYNITEISRMGLLETDLVADDGLHPSGLQYGLWVDKIMLDYEGSVTNLEESAGRLIEVYPNPSNEKITIGNYKGVYTISNSNGEIVQNGLVEDSIDISVLKQGVYYVQFNGIVTKFLKL